MALVVVRCLGCRGASRVATSVLGVPVECPRCGASFQAIEEATLIVPGAGWVAPNPPPARAWRGPTAPSELDDEFEEDNDELEDDEDSDLEDESDDSEPVQGKPEHDPHEETSSPLPASVYIGLSLLPFLIPIVWSISSVIVRQPPVLTVGTPLALAVATSILCMAVISTIDWTPATRIKGVLLLVALSYFTGVGLYFLKKDMVDRVRRVFGNDHRLIRDEPLKAGYRVMVPAPSHPFNGPSPMKDISLTCQQVNFTRGFQGPYTFVYGSSEPQKPLAGVKAQNPELGTDAWFDAAIADIVKQSGALLHGHGPEKVQYEDQVAGRELAIKLQDGQMVRVVRVFVIKGRVYYLAVERMHLEPDDDLVREFFDSFEVR